MKKIDSTRRSFLASASAIAAAAAVPPSLSAAAPAETPASKADPEKPGRTPNTRFAVNIEMWFRGPLERRVLAAAELGYPAIEFWPHDNKDIPALAKLLEEHGMTATQFTAWGFGRELNDPRKPADAFIRAIEKSCDVADALPGCDLFTVVAGDDIEGLSKEEMHAAVVEKIKKVAGTLEKRKKTIIIEPMNPYNHPRHCLYGSKDGIAMCRAIGSENVKLNWDLFHMQRFEGNLIDNMKKGKEWIGYLQLADSPARNEPGTGEINYTNVFRAIREIGYERPVGLECSPEGGDTKRAATRIHAADTW